MKQKDDAVAEIIGTVLIFVIVVTLLTAYASWYVPLQEQRSQQDFYQNSISAESELSAKLMQGYNFVQSFPAGISGGFGNTFDTYLSFVNISYGALSMKFMIIYSTAGKNMSENYTIDYTQAGLISAYPSSSFLSQIAINDYGSFLTDGSVFYGPLYIHISNTSFSASLVRMNGENFSESSSSSLYVSGTVLTKTSSIFAVNGATNINGTAATVRSIKLLDLNYTINGPFADSLEKYIMVESGMGPISGNISVGSYRFSLVSNRMVISLTSPLDLDAMDLLYLSYYVSL
ncbi:MAG: hypothetical protein OWQ34_00315 [Thermoplasma acidophilum]|nr:hypothetical protein [Thermoplasma acidophilum]